MSGLPRKRDTIAIQAVTTVNGADASLGQVDVRNYSTAVILLKYANGDETNIIVTPKYLIADGGDTYEQMEWSSDADALRTAKRFLLSATADAYIVLDVRGMKLLEIFQLVTAGTPTGTLKVDVELINE